MGGDEFWQAVIQCDKAYDGVFWYGVKTVGVYCRPSCKSRTPLRKNVWFFEKTADAAAAGFRPCKRCRPDLPDYDPSQELAQQAKALMDKHYGDRENLAVKRRQMGASPNHLAEVFQKQYGLSPAVYLRRRRLDSAKRLLKKTNRPIVEIGEEIGFASLSAFYAFFKRHTGKAPGAYRREAKGQEGQA